ncbi:hypothetical protein VP01_3778g6 [Puccinia sorghi]|uniref:Uncharacterized protein n=1 Tax=Puccinia sorghi TaxID=27349 RepID=A0A0L6UTN1_9BASI|nr:hypothetical protein VP01_3778g6 [Puccinia sorghi]
MVTITDMMRPLIEEFLKLNQSVKVNTAQFSEGQIVTAKLGALIGNIVATHKVAGFTSHSGKRFCSWCNVLNTNITKMTIGRLLNQRDTLACARDWLNSTAGVRKKLVKQTGVRSLELNRLPWNPIRNVVLGVMYNCRNQRKLEVPGKVEMKQPYGGTFWSVAQKKRLVAFVFEVVSVKNGKLKSSEWHTLFAIHLPLAAISVFCESEAFDECLQKNKNAIDNSTALVRCTNIVSSNKVSPQDPEDKTYMRTSQMIFPEIKILPNHHYVLQIPQQLKWWGPLMAV